MENENTNNQGTTQGTEQNESNVDYIEAIKKLRESTVDKSEYDKLKEDNRKLLDSLINGETIDVQNQKEKVDVNKIRKELFSEDCDMCNLDYISKALDLRDAIIEQGGRDPFLPYGEKIMPTDEDIATAEKVAEALKDCVEYADGDSSIFTSELQRIMVDTAPARKRGR